MGPPVGGPEPIDERACGDALAMWAFDAHVEQSLGKLQNQRPASCRAPRPSPPAVLAVTRAEALGRRVVDATRVLVRYGPSRFERNP